MRRNRLDVVAAWYDATLGLRAAFWPRVRSLSVKVLYRPPAGLGRSSACVRKNHLNIAVNVAALVNGNCDGLLGEPSTLMAVAAISATH